LSDIILKGQGVWYMDENGMMHPMSFPPPDSDHENISHFHINSKTGKPFKELEGKGLVGKFPIEIAAGIFARELMEQGYKDENGIRRKPASEASALRVAKTVFNNATKDFNKIKREHNDDFNVLPMKFDENGQLHPDYKNNHYGGHVSRRVPTSKRATRTKDGKVINNHPRNEQHKQLGQHLESAAFHIEKEFRNIAEQMGVESVLGAKQNVLEPQQLTQGITHRYTSKDRPPTHRDNTLYPSHYKDLHSQTAAYGKYSPMDIVSILPPDFFVPSTEGNMSKKVMNQLIEMGYDQPTARSMARAPINQLLYGRGSEGAETNVNKIVRNMRNVLRINSDEDVHNMFANHRSHIAREVEGGDRGRNAKAVEILAMMKTAQELGVEPAEYSLFGSPPPSIVNGWRQIALNEGGKKVDLDALGSVDERHAMRGNFASDMKHIYESFPEHLSGGSTADVLPPQPIVSDMPMSEPPPALSTQEPLPPAPVQPQINPSFNPYFDPSSFQFSDDDPMGIIATIMERVQMHDAGGSLLVKYDPMDNFDMQKLGQDVGMSSIDVRAIAMSLGDWGVIAKSFNTTHDVVRAIKRSCGGAING
tara:strand:- start:23491 stop:25263 length:1773 start_codon:yes stop_codon:yes gene_type:complete